MGMLLHQTQMARDSSTGESASVSKFPYRIRSLKDDLNQAKPEGMSDDAQ